MAITGRPLATADLDQLQRKAYFPTADVSAYSQAVMGATNVDTHLTAVGIQKADIEADKFFTLKTTAPYTTTYTDAEAIAKLSGGYSNLTLSTQTGNFSLTYYPSVPLQVVPFTGTPQLQGVTGFPDYGTGFSVLMVCGANGAILSFDMTAFLDQSGIGLTAPSTAGQAALYTFVNLNVDGFPKIGVSKVGVF